MRVRMGRCRAARRRAADCGNRRLGMLAATVSVAVPRICPASRRTPRSRQAGALNLESDSWLAVCSPIFRRWDAFAPLAVKPWCFAEDATPPLRGIQRLHTLSQLRQTARGPDTAPAGRPARRDVQPPAPAARHAGTARAHPLDARDIDHRGGRETCRRNSRCLPPPPLSSPPRAHPDASLLPTRSKRLGCQSDGTPVQAAAGLPRGRAGAGRARARQNLASVGVRLRTLHSRHAMSLQSFSWETRSVEQRMACL